MTDEQNDMCKAIIHSAAVSAGAIGAIPIPGSDIVPIVGIQVTMIVALARVFKYPITKNLAQEMAKTYMMGQAAKILVGQLVKIIPFGSGANVAVAAGLTETLGWETAERFYKETA